MSIPVSIHLFVFPHIYISQVYSRSIFVLVSVTLHFHTISCTDLPGFLAYAKGCCDMAAVADEVSIGYGDWARLAKAVMELPTTCSTDLTSVATEVNALSLPLCMFTGQVNCSVIGSNLSPLSSWTSSTLSMLVLSSSRNHKLTLTLFRALRTRQKRCPPPPKKKSAARRY